ncbi:hypothetical protein HMPREF9372_1602 [Sporosarcina newyorkensis 2681]|uniref:Uncharacterized protein n=1 Tax=Sporosarcina newyorkensis 2681 TaxID=1027292 RepID=F9DS22_9BACL|nr:hypothetical protein [Sporosarcina newyorkensis]EGQ26322.1 hypothetical protein HMPREF9372_1602 [Sporosarcina newyorkensis 2681]
MKGKTVAIGLIIFVIVVVGAVYFMVQATFKNNPTQKNHPSVENQSYIEPGTYGWQLK